MLDTRDSKLKAERMDATGELPNGGHPEKPTPAAVPRDFCKLFVHPELGQILVMKRAGEDGPEVTITVNSGIEGINPVVMTVGFPDNEIGKRAADVALEKTDEATAYTLAKQALHPLRGFISAEEPIA